MTFQTSKMLTVAMNINFILAQFEQRSKNSLGLFSVFFMEKNETEEKLAAAHVLFELLIVGRNFILSMTLHSYNIK